MNELQTDRRTRLRGVAQPLRLAGTSRGKRRERLSQTRRSRNIAPLLFAVLNPARGGPHVDAA
jgi:hypothetical protein